MNIYKYWIEDGQFSDEFTAPLLGKVGSKVQIYDYIGDEISESREITIHEINTELKTVECTSNSR